MVTIHRLEPIINVKFVIKVLNGFGRLEQLPTTGIQNPFKNRKQERNVNLSAL